MWMVSQCITDWLSYKGKYTNDENVLLENKVSIQNNRNTSYWNIWSHYLCLIGLVVCELILISVHSAFHINLNCI